MLYTIRHQWCGGAHFTLSYYRHSVKLLVLLPGELETEYILRREGVNPRRTLSVVLYGLILSMLMEKIQGGHSIFLQSWYADEFIMEGVDPNIKPAI